MPNYAPRLSPQSDVHYYRVITIGCSPGMVLKSFPHGLSSRDCPLGVVFKELSSTDYLPMVSSRALFKGLSSRFDLQWLYSRGCSKQIVLKSCTPAVSSNVGYRVCHPGFVLKGLSTSSCPPVVILYRLSSKGCLPWVVLQGLYLEISYIGCPPGLVLRDCPLLIVLQWLPSNSYPSGVVF